jgi:photosystem II stability/assembly factor-like uncharacterized protein
MHEVQRHRPDSISLAASLAVVTLLNAVYPAVATAQWTTIDAHTQASFRGLSVAPDGTIWLGGTHGTVLRSIDAGATWSVDTVPGAGSFDFRGMAAIDSHSAYAMVAHADTGRIYKTTDEGRTWQLQYRGERPGVFLDGLECWDAYRCFSVGDPIGGHFLVVSTIDAGAHWVEHAARESPMAAKGEAIFAASATSVIVGPRGTAFFVTGGGPVARVWRSTDYGATWDASDTPVTAGRPSAGLFSMVFCPSSRAIAVGGDYKTPAETGSHVAISTDGGATWAAGDQDHATPYLSGMACGSGRRDIIVAVGTTGVFVSQDALLWIRSSNSGFNAVAITKGVVVTVGDRGAIARAQLSSLSLPALVD